ncbi:hypothetical protein [Myroides pelagicus]|uniref:Uncharacterized protein n=1 Tax=Myroides pelagicus TaxID=270914 RepID=A0A7K1GI30_9FLAO|nr:hypothetical protein [Myroides pelagicus]MEC4115175.1 hypothetical protein [Myroides pelagicus]MTH28450.1 hypothetical protein [Myroides pelagicus]
MSLGSNVFGVKVTGLTEQNQSSANSIYGYNEGNITAYVAIEMAFVLLTTTPVYGVKHIHQLIQDIPAFLHRLKQYDQTIKINLSESK